MSTQDNDTINTRSQDNHNPISPGQQLIKILEGHDRILHKLTKNKPIDVDIYESESGATGICTLQSQVRMPWMLTDIFATWAVPGNAQSFNTEGSVTSPGAGAQLAAIGAGNNLGYTYNAYVTVTLAGTVAQGVDNDNIELNFTGPGAPIIINNNISTVEQTFGPFVIKPTAGTLIRLQAINLATVGAIYSVSLTIIPVLSAVTLQLRDRIIPLPAAPGFFIASSMHGMQLDLNSRIVLTTSPPVQCHLEVMGYSDPRKFDE